MTEEGFEQRFPLTMRFDRLTLCKYSDIFTNAIISRETPRSAYFRHKVRVLTAAARRPSSVTPPPKNI